MADRFYALIDAPSTTGRRFSGIASHPEADRVGDEIVMAGVHAPPEIPLLLWHDHRAPVGIARLGTPGPRGIPFEAEIPEVAEPGPVQELCDKAAQLVKVGLIRAVSIGFRVLDNAVERLASGGLRILKAEILELSLVTVPANAHARIETVRALCKSQAAAPLPVVRITPVRAVRAAPTWTPPADLNDMHVRALQIFVRQTGIVPAPLFGEAARRAHETLNVSPADLTDAEIAHLALEGIVDPMRVVEERRAARDARARAAITPRVAKDSAVTATDILVDLAVRVAALEGRHS